MTTNPIDRLAFQPHWHVFCGESEEEVRERQYDYLLPIWDAAAYWLKLKERFNIIGWKRLYMNAHTFGVEPHMHTDDGDFTMMYYPRMDWQPEWLGGILLFGTIKEKILQNTLTMLAIVF